MLSANASGVDTAWHAKLPIVERLPRGVRWSRG